VRHALAKGRKRPAFETIQIAKMSGFINQSPGRSATAAPDSKPDPVAEADELALSKIRSMCAVAMASAKAVALGIQNDMTRLNKLRFASAKRMSLELAKTIAGTTYRDAALGHIIELCMTANDMESSSILVHGIQSTPIREEILLTYPTLLR
jgi:hypothetical protein